MRDIAEIQERLSRAFASPAASGPSDAPASDPTVEQIVPPIGMRRVGSALSPAPLSNLFNRIFAWRRKNPVLRLTDALRDAEAESAAKSRQIATVVHEIRTPLNGILGMTHLLGQTKLTAEQQNYLSGIRQSGYALAQLVEDLLDYSTLEAGRFRLNNRAENLRQLIESVVELLAPRAHEKRLEIAATIDAAVPEFLDFDPGRIRQVLFNVIGNAVKFTVTGGVLVRVTLQGSTVSIAVNDTGPGMTAQEQAQVFGEFEQGGTAETRSGGTGLGLGIASRILTEFGGSLSVSSRKGAGSTFTVRFPLQLAEDAPAGQGDRGTLLARTRVLLLAPDGPAATATCASIETLGGQCRHVSSPARVQMLIDRAAGGPSAYTDLIVDHRLASDYACEPSHGPLHRILLVNPEERASQPQDFFDAWLIRPLREKSLIDVLSGRLRRFGPRDAFADSRALPQSADPSAEPGLDIVLGEDDPVNAMLVRAVLKKAGHRVRLMEDFPSLMIAASGADGGRVDLVICDMHMPGGTLEAFLGQHAALTAHPEGKPIPIMVLTGEARSDIRQQALADGAAIVLQKPVDPRILAEQVRLICPAGGNRQQVR
ncbi:MAG: ATP-binding protein [Neorhizobium sp.]|nr:ATP-binding protein [Neorhizobium sp.]